MVARVPTFRFWLQQSIDGRGHQHLVLVYLPKAYMYMYLGTYIYSMYPPTYIRRYKRSFMGVGTYTQLRIRTFVVQYILVGKVHTYVNLMYKRVQ